MNVVRGEDILKFATSEIRLSWSELGKRFQSFQFLNSIELLSWRHQAQQLFSIKLWNKKSSQEFKSIFLSLAKYSTIAIVTSEFYVNLWFVFREIHETHEIREIFRIKIAAIIPSLLLSPMKFAIIRFDIMVWRRSRYGAARLIGYA